MLNDLALGYKSPKTKKERHKILLSTLELLEGKVIVPMLNNNSTDYSLTPENCKEKGHEWIKDIIFDPEAPEITNKDIFTFLQKGYKLGIPASRNVDNNLVGLYQPIKNDLQKNLEKICQEYYQKYSEEGLKVNIGRLRALAIISTKKAKENYLKLKSPKTCSEEVYIYHWVREALDKGYVLKTLTKIDFRNPPTDPYFKAIAEYFLVFPRESLDPINKEINNAEPIKRLRLWKSYSLPTEEIEKRFKKVIVERKKFLQRRNEPYIEVILRKNKIPKANYGQFIKNKDKVITFCSKPLPDPKQLPNWFYLELNLPCFICRVKKFPFETLENVFNSVSCEYPVLKQFKARVKVAMGDKNWTRYKKEEDYFLVTLNKNVNFRHQTISFIHELGHVINFLNDFKKGEDFLGKGKYLGEKETFKLELKILEKLSKEILEASLTNLLLTFWKITFEIELYNNPLQNIGELYAHSFNACFPKARQKRNPFYILDDSLITAPFSSLPHAIAYAEVILDLKK